MPTTCLNYDKKCGGCPLLALPYREQLNQKQARLQGLLGGFAPVRAVQGMAEPYHYRNKAIASFAMQHGKLVCGLYAEGTHRVLPSADCLLQEEILNKTLAAVLEAARACRWTAYDEDRGTGLLRHTVLRSSGDGKVLVTLVTPGADLPGSKNFCAALRKKAPWVVSIVQNINPTRSSAVLGNREKPLWGPGYVLDTLCGLQFAISSRSFYQVNRTQTEVLYKKALELAKLTGRETVVDAYCGIGTIGLCAAPHAKQVIGVERNPAAVRDAAANARRNKLANARFVCADATEWMMAAAAEGLRPDVVFLDPPRAGSTPECIAAVNRMKPKRIVYVSCDPETLARDVAAFTRLGWRAAKFCPVDLFPQTRHVEGVITCNTDTFYGVGTNPVIAVFTAHEPHPDDKICKFIDFRNDGYEVRAHIGLVEGDSAKDKRQHLLDVWNGRTKAASKFCVESTVKAEDEWLHSFFYFNDDIPAEMDFEKAIGDFLTFEFSMIMQNREYLFQQDGEEHE